MKIYIFIFSKVNSTPFESTHAPVQSENVEHFAISAPNTNGTS